MKAITAEVFQTSVKAQISNKDAGWGQKQSLAVVKDMVKQATGEECSESLALAIGQVINPSAFRQVLEKQGLLNVQEKKSKRLDKAFSNFAKS